MRLQIFDYNLRAPSFSCGCMLQTRLQYQISSGNPVDGGVQAMEDHLRRVQLQHTRLQGAHDSVMQALHPSHAEMGADSLADNPAADAGSNSSGKLCMCPIPEQGNSSACSFMRSA